MKDKALDGQTCWLLEGETCAKCGGPMATNGGFTWCASCGTMVGTDLSGPAASEVKEAIDKAVDTLKRRCSARDERASPWIAYFFECLNVELGDRALEEAKQMLTERLERGGW